MSGLICRPTVAGVWGREVRGKGVGMLRATEKGGGRGQPVHVNIRRGPHWAELNNGVGGGGIEPTHWD